MSPYTGAGAGQFAGFLFYYDQPSAKNNKVSTKLGKNTIQKTKLNGSGIIYLVNQTLNITNDAVVTINPGSIIADFILPDSGTLNLTGSLNSSLAVLNSMKKKGAASGGPTLVR